jgi:CheY-like chemotaxis protein
MTTSQIILVAEDEDNDFFLLEKAFSRHADTIRVIRVCDGEEAIDYLAGNNGFEDRTRFPLPDLLLLDVKMPRRDGLEVLRWVRNQSRLKTLVTVILSSSKEENDVRQAYTLGANSYLKKPCNYSDYLEMTRVLTAYWSRWVERPPANAASGQPATSESASFHITPRDFRGTVSE